MGAECCNESKTDQSVLAAAPSATSAGGATVVATNVVEKVVVQKDLPSVSLDGKDAYEKFELSLPFCRT